MYNTHQPSDAELPSTRQLIRSTFIALAIAIVILVTTVLPAEYAIDPTGIGRILGLTQMGKVKIYAQMAANGQTASASNSSVDPSATTTPSGKSGEISVILMPGEGAEVKVEMRKGKRVSYRWSANGGVVNYDTHGEPYKASRYFSHSYQKGRGVPKDEGTLEAAFDGHHGWYWENRTKKVLKVTLWVNGDYIKLKRLL